MSDEIIVESIKKLMALKMSDEEIIGSLMDAGVEYDQAKDVLDEIKSQDTKPKEKKREIRDPKKTVEIKDIDNIKDISTEESTTEDEVNNLENASLGIWQQGVLTTVNQKLEDIEDKEKEIDKSIEDKITNITNAEIKKMKIILDSQRTLLLSKINSTLDIQVKEISSKIETTLDTMQKINKETQLKLDELNKTKIKVEEIQENLINQMDEFNKIRDNTQELVEQMKGNVGTEIKTISEQYDSKLSEVDKKLNSMISLSTKILDGLVGATKKKLDSYYDKRADDVIVQIKEKIDKEDYFKDQKEQFKQKLEEIEKGIESKANDKIGEYLKKLNEIDGKLLEIRKIRDNMVDEISVKVDDYFARKKIGIDSTQQSIMDLNSRLAELENRLKVSKSKSDDMNTQTIEELILFKDQYAKIVTKLMQDIKELKGKKA